MTKLIATFFYVGLLRPAPGTWGSLAAIPAAWALHQAGGFVALLLGTLVVFGWGWYATIVETSGRVFRLTGTLDSQYAEWRQILRQIFAIETGLPVDAGAEETFSETVE